MATIAQAVGLTETVDASSLVSGSVTTTSGHGLMVVVLNRASSDTAVSSVIDGPGNTWVSQYTSSTGTGSSRIEVWATTAASPAGLSSQTVTVHFAGSCSAVGYLFEISGGTNTGLIDHAAVATAGSGTAASSGSSGTLGASNLLAIGVVGGNSNVGNSGTKTFTQGAPGTNYTHAESPATNDLGLDAGTLVITTTTAQTYSATLDFGTAWGAAVVVLKTGSGNATAPAGLANVAVAAGGPGSPGLPADAIVGTPAARMICWGGDEWLSQSSGTYATWKANGWGGFQFTTGSPYTPAAGAVSTATAAGFESYEGTGYYDNSQSGSYWGGWATNIASVGMTGLSFDTEQNTWSAVSTATAMANGQAIAQAMWGAYPGMVLLYYHYYLPGSFNDLFYQTVDASPNPHVYYQQDAFFYGLLAGMQAVNATGRIVLVDATFYRDSGINVPGSTNKTAYFYSSQNARAQLSNNLAQSVWNYACDHFDWAGFTWRGTDGTGFYDSTEPPDSEWAQSVVDARNYSEGPRRAEYVFDSQWPPTPEMQGGANEPWSYTDPTLLGTIGGATGSIPASSGSSITTAAPTITSPSASIVGTTVTITCSAFHAYGIRCVKVYNGSTFTSANPPASYLGAMNMVWQTNGGSITTNYASAYQACTFATTGAAGQYFVLEAISIKDDTHWVRIQVPGGGTPGNANPGVANVVVAAWPPTSVTGGGSRTATAGVANVAVSDPSARITIANVGVGWQPAWQLLVAFNNLPLDDPTLITTVASPPGTLGAVNVWTDITKDLRTQLDTNRGKQHEVDRTQTGSMTFTLDNRSGNYNPWNTSSPYTGKIKPGVPFQLRATFLGVTFNVFTGLLDTVAPGWTAPSYDAVTVTCFDLFNYLNNTYVIPDYPAVVAADAAQLYLRLNDVAGTTRAADVFRNNALVNYATVVFGASPGAVGAWTGVDLANGGTTPAGFIDLNPNGLMAGSTWTVEFWYKVASEAAFTALSGFNAVVFKQYLDQTDYMTIYVAPSTGQLGGYVQVGASINSFLSTSPVPADGNWHHAVVTSAQTVYIDGLPVPVTSSSSATVSFTPAQGYLGYNHGTTGPTWPGLLQEFAIYPSVLTAAQVAAHYYAATVNVTETSDNRIRHVAGWVGLPLANATIYAGNSTLQPDATNLAMTSALSYLQAIEQTEAGLLYIDTAGHLKFVNRGTIYTSLTSTATFGDGGGTEIPFELNPQIATDTQDLYATVTITRNNGATVTVGNQAGFNNYNVSGLMGNSDSEIVGYANWFLTQLGTAKPRIRLVNVHPVVTSTTGAATNVLLALDLGTVVTVNRHTLPGNGTAFTQISYVEGINFHLLPDTGDWNVDLQLTPLFPERPWILGVSQLGTDTTLFF